MAIVIIENIVLCSTESMAVNLWFSKRIACAPENAIVQNDYITSLTPSTLQGRKIII